MLVVCEQLNRFHIVTPFEFLNDCVRDVVIMSVYFGACHADWLLKTSVSHKSSLPGYFVAEQQTTIKPRNCSQSKIVCVTIRNRQSSLTNNK